MRVGSVEIPGRVALGPLAGYTDYPFRATVASFGCPYAVTPLVAAEGLCRRNAATLALLATGPDDAAVVAAQLFGGKPRAMADAARFAADLGFKLIDINLGCPSPRIRRQSAAAALMDDLTTLRKVIRAVVNASPVPVTAKIRLGATLARTVTVARLLAEEGISALAVHGRTVAQGFRGPVNAQAIGEVVAVVAIPVWANGGVVDGPSAAALLKATGAAGVMLGRAVLGRPYVVRDIENYLTEGVQPPPPSPAELAATIWAHFQRAADRYGERRAARRFRAHLHNYFTALPGARDLRARAAAVGHAADVRAVIASYLKLADDGQGEIN